MTEAQTAQRREWRAAGRCGQCGQPAIPGKRYCGPHREARNRAGRVYRQRRYRERRAAGQCVDCGQAAAGKVRCPRHMQRVSAGNARRRQVEQA